MKEKDLYPQLSRLVSSNYDKFKCAAFELKVARKGKYYLSQLEVHQARALRMVKRNGVYHKISDESRVSKPFDSFLLKGNAYVVIYWEESKRFYFIGIEKYPQNGTTLSEVECEFLASFLL